MVPARLTASREIRATFAGGSVASCRSAVLFLRARGDDAPTRLAVVAGRKVGGAVVRNRAKRRLRAAAAAAHWPTGHDAVLSARTAAVSTPFGQLTADVATMIHKITIKTLAGAA